MKMKHILLFTISVFCVSFSVKAQDSTKVVVDSLKMNQQKYGLRIGGDLSKLARTLFEEGYTGFEINGDLRFSKRFYAAAEILSAHLCRKHKRLYPSPKASKN